MIISIFGVVTIFVISTVLFKKAAGTLALNRLNIISYVYYLFILQVFIGTSLIFLGFDNHYTLNYLVNREESIEMTVDSVVIMMLMLPIVIIMFNKIFKIDVKEEFTNFLNKDIVSTKTRRVYILLGIIAIIQTGLLVVQLIKTGYIPILKLVFPSEGFDFALERQINQGDIFVINEYVTNIIIKFGIPIIGYITFSYALIEKKFSWWLLSIVYFIESVIIKTYDFSKSPIIFHLFIYALILLYIKHDVIKNKFIIIFGVGMACILVILYRVMGFQGSFLDIYNGILGRTFFTQVGTLTYHFDLFTNVFEPLNGRSLPPTILSLIGQNPDEHLRSAKLVMDFYGSEHVAEGTAGVMNACFLGEAYANWGWIGCLLSIVYVGLYLSLAFLLILRIKKTPVTICMLAIFTQTIGAMTQGGFVDFVYSISMILVLFGCLFLIYLDNIYNWFIQRLRRKNAME